MAADVRRALKIPDPRKRGSVIGQSSSSFPQREDIEAFLKEHDIDLPDLDELKDKAEDLLGGGKEGIADAIKGIGGLFDKK